MVSLSNQVIVAPSRHASSFDTLRMRLLLDVLSQSHRELLQLTLAQSSGAGSVDYPLPTE